MPSLEFLLYKNEKNEMIFPFFKIKNKQKLNKKIINYSNFLLNYFNYEINSIKIQGYIDIDTNILKIQERIEKALGLKVYIINKKKNSGKVTIEYKDLEQFDLISDLLTKR